MILAEKSESPEVLPLPHPDFFRAASLALSKSTSQNDIAKYIILNDAKITLRMGSASCERVTAWVTGGGVITPRKGVTIPLSVNRQESLLEFDNFAIMATRNLHGVRYAISYVKDAAEMAIYRSLLGQSAFLIAKLERQSALDDAAQIACYANELWLCRGDLGAELGMKNMAEQVHQFSSKIRQMHVPILMAGQVLEHMTEHATPTRSEICFLYETLTQGFNGVVLSDETAIGKFPVETCAAAALFK
jgi:pyruvate kinase